MKKTSLFLFLFITFIFSGCGGSSEDSTATQKVKAVNTLDKNMTEAYQMYVEQALSNRVRAFKLYEDVQNIDPLSATNLREIKFMLQRYLQNKDLTTTHVNEYQYLVSQSDEAYSEKERLELVMMSLSAMLIRYDDYLLAYSKYDEHEKLNDVLNAADSEYGIGEDTLDDDILSLYEDDTDRENINKMITFYRGKSVAYKDDTNSYFIYLKTLIEDSPSYKLGFEDEFFLFGWLYSVSDWISDLTDDAFSSFFNTVSENIGNTAGLVETRVGKLYADEEVRLDVTSTLQSGDILLEKTPFRLTDSLIPGYWGHVAVYIGTKSDLIEMGIWDDLNASVQADIEAGKVIDEALRDGVQLNTIEHFLNVDDLAIMHDDYETHEDKITRIRRVIKQLGKEYDFEYDIEDNSKIICSELVYITSVNIEWDTSSTVGINTISPDNVAIKSTDSETVFSIPILYHDGVKIQTEHKEYMSLLLEEYEE